MRAINILVVKMGGGYLKAILPDRREIVFGRDEKELAGRLKLRGISEPISVVKRTQIGQRKFGGERAC
jgi:hypothetical protein